MYNITSSLEVDVNKNVWYIFYEVTHSIFIDMKTLTCDLCDALAEGETFEEWLRALHHHYNEEHAEVLNDTTRTKEEMSEWMQKNRERFAEAEDE